jgi:magnesium chelatase family protein
MVPLLPQGILALSQVGKQVKGESSAQIKIRVEHAQAIQISRQGKLNNALTTQQIKQFCQLSLEDAQFLESAINKLGLSIRAWHSLLKVARSIADLAMSEEIQRQHLTESLSYRAMDRLLKSVSY